MRLLSEAEFTESEQELYDAFRLMYELDHSISVFRDQIVCLHCGRCTYNGLYPPGIKEIDTSCKCPKTKGSTAKPDILLMEHRPHLTNITHIWDDHLPAVVRVDGGIHTKNRRHMMWDHHQVEKLKTLGFKVFIVKNEELHTELCRNAIASYIFSMMHHDNLYQQYLRSGDVMERTRRPL